MKKVSFRNDVLPLKNVLYRLALRITLSHEDAEDIVQDTLMKVWNRRDEWDNIDSMEAYCLTVCRNLALDSNRKAANRAGLIDDSTLSGSPFHTSAEDTAKSETLVSPLPSPLSVVQRKDRLQLVRQLVDTLPEKQRTCIQLRDFEGKAYKEIAQILQISEDQVKVSIYRARQTIKQRYEQLDQYGL